MLSRFWRKKAVFLVCLHFKLSLHFVPGLQSAVCILYLVCILYPVCSLHSLQSAVCILYWPNGLHSALTALQRQPRLLVLFRQMLQVLLHLQPSESSDWLSLTEKYSILRFMIKKITYITQLELPTNPYL